MSSPALAERYGTARPGRRRALLAGCAVVVLAFLGWLAWTIVDQTTPAVSSELESFSVGDEHTTTAVLVVTVSGDDVRATCKLRAFAEDHTVVGEISFTPDPSRRRQVQDIRTERRATSVESLGCTAPGQVHPR